MRPSTHLFLYFKFTIICRRGISHAFKFLSNIFLKIYFEKWGFLSLNLLQHCMESDILMSSKERAEEPNATTTKVQPDGNKHFVINR
jgi:hypothetical protein